MLTFKEKNTDIAEGIAEIHDTHTEITFEKELLDTDVRIY